ncbi:hypothetical protein ACTMU2_39375 [Cupriavidus basilensis]
MQLNPKIRERLGGIAGITHDHGRHARWRRRPGGRSGFRSRAMTSTSCGGCRRRQAAACLAIRGLTDLDSSMKDDRPTIEVRIRRQLASDLGVGVAQIGNALRPRCSRAACHRLLARAGTTRNYDVR